MGRYVPIRFNDDEAAFLERSFAASDDQALSSHIKRVYFDALRPNTDAIQGMRVEMEKIGLAISQIQTADSPATDQQLHLSVLCGLYVMVRRSVILRLLHTLVHVVVQLMFDRESGRHVPAIYYDPMYALSVVR